MSLEQAISDHASAIRELAAAILKAGDRVTTTHQVGDVVTETKAAPKEEKAASEKKAPPAEKAAAATGTNTAKPQTTASAASASTIDYASIRGKVLDLTKQAEGRDRCGALLARFGVTKGPDLKAEQLEDFNALLDQTLAGEYDPRSAVDPAGDADDGMA